MSVKISAYIISFNEEKNIEDCLKSLHFCDEIIVVDSFSTDKTEAIAKSFSNVVFFKREWKNFSDQKQFALVSCKHDWTINLDCDERIDEELAQSIIDEKPAMKRQDFHGYYFKRKDLFKGQKPSNLSRDELSMRLTYKPLSTIHSVLVHEGISLNSKKIKTLNGEFIHLGHNDPVFFRKKLTQYADLKAKESFKKASWLRLFLSYPLEFIRQYILYRRFFNPINGFLKSHELARYSMLKALYRIKYKKQKTA